MLLAKLREQGLRFVVEGGRLRVEPRSAVTEPLRATIRINKSSIIRELAAEAVDREKALAAARDAAQLEEWRAPLVLGRLVVCGNCAAFEFDAAPSGLGYCRDYGTEAAPFVPFQCPRFQTAKKPTAPAYLPDPDLAIGSARVRAA